MKELPSFALATPCNNCLVLVNGIERTAQLIFNAMRDLEVSELYTLEGIKETLQTAFNEDEGCVQFFPYGISSSIRVTCYFKVQVDEL